MNTESSRQLDGDGPSPVRIEELTSLGRAQASLLLTGPGSLSGAALSQLNLALETLDLMRLV